VRRVATPASRIGPAWPRVAEMTWVLFTGYKFGWGPTETGLSLAAVGLLLMLIRITDVITDPIIGVWSDRVRTRFGRRKPFVLLGTPLYVAAAWFLFFPPFEFSEVTWAGMTFDSGYVWLGAALFMVYLARP